jgi:hypothetical protein
MLHLLTDEYKKKVSREYTYRVLIVVSIIVCVLSVIGLLLVAPSYMKIHSTHIKITSERDSYAEKIKLRQDDNSIDGVRGVMNTISALKTYNPQYSVRAIVLDLVSKKQKGISISHIVFDKSKDAPTLEVAGKAHTRTSLVSFSEELKKDTNFSGVVVPLSSFAREKDIDFSLKLTVVSSPNTHEK